MAKDREIRIAMADDHAMLRKSLREVINQMEGIRVLFDVDNGVQLIEKMESSPELPNVCVLDINMPEMNGYDTAQEIKKKWPNMKILALSMYDNEFNIIRMLRNGASGYILKDSDPQELYKAIYEVYEHGFYQSDIVSGHMLHLVHNKTDRELNDNEIQFLRYCCTELTYKEIADKMNKSPRTIDGYRETLFTRLNINSRTGLAIYAIKTGLYTV